MERAADIYSTVEGFGTSKGKVSGSIQKADYMSVYTSDLVEAVRKAAGNIGISELFHQSRNLFGDQHPGLTLVSANLRGLKLLVCVQYPSIFKMPLLSRVFFFLIIWD